MQASASQRLFKGRCLKITMFFRLFFFKHTLTVSERDYMGRILLVAAFCSQFLSVALIFL